MLCLILKILKTTACSVTYLPYAQVKELPSCSFTHLYLLNILTQQERNLFSSLDTSTMLMAGSQTIYPFFWHRPTVKPVTHIPAFNWSTNVATLVVEQVATCCIQCISVLIQQCSVFQHSMRHGTVFIDQDRQNKLINKCWTVWP